MTRPPLLSNTRYLAGRQCKLRLWYQCYEAHLAAEPDEVTQQLTDWGRHIGELAQERFPGGVLVQEPYWQPCEALATTERLLASDAPALFESAFAHGGVFVRVDVLARAPGGAWDLIEVESTHRVTELHERDLGLQLWVLRGAGVAIRRAGVLTLNPSRPRDRTKLDLDELFVLHDRTAVCAALQGPLTFEVKQLHAIIGRREAPHVPTGTHCKNPDGCEFAEHCGA